MSQKQISDLIYSIGETILLEIEDIKRIEYPKLNEFPDTITISLKGGEKLELLLRPIGEY